MKVFISWSKDYSKEIAVEFRKWIKSVLQLTDPFMSDQDIDLGMVPLEKIKESLATSKFGIIIVTSENIDSQWMNFEAGALSNSMENSRIIPVLFGLNDLGTSPLNQYQSALHFGEVEIKKLVESANNLLGDKGLPKEVLDETFSMWWPKLENKVSEIVKKYEVEEKLESRLSRSGPENEEKNKTFEVLDEIKISNVRNNKMILELANTINKVQESQFMFRNENEMRSIEREIDRELSRIINTWMKTEDIIEGIASDLIKLSEMSDSSRMRTDVVTIDKVAIDHILGKLEDASFMMRSVMGKIKL